MRGSPTQCFQRHGEHERRSRKGCRRAVFSTMRWRAAARTSSTSASPTSVASRCLPAAFPNARFVDITRDGRAVAVSLSRVDWWESSVVWVSTAARAEGVASTTGRGDPWEILCARNWVEEVRAIDSGIEELNPKQVLRLTYEEFTAEPVAHHRARRRIRGTRRRSHAGGRDIRAHSSSETGTTRGRRDSRRRWSPPLRKCRQAS